MKQREAFLVRITSSGNELHTEKPGLSFQGYLQNKYKYAHSRENTTSSHCGGHCASALEAWVMHTEEAYAWRLPSLVPLIHFILLICLFALLLSLLFLFVTTNKIFVTVFTTFFILIIIVVTLTIILNHYFPNLSSNILLLLYFKGFYISCLYFMIILFSYWSYLIIHGQWT